MITLVRQRLLNQTTNFQIARTFLTNQQLGIDRFIQSKERNVVSNKDVLISNVKTSLSGDGFVYTEDLKGLAYAVDTPEDAKLLKEAFIKFASKGEPIRLATFKIGPVVSRALYHVDDLESLKELFENDKTSEYFQLRTAYNVYLSFLYKKEQYEEVLNAGEKMFEKMINEVRNDQRSRFFGQCIDCLPGRCKQDSDKRDTREGEKNDTSIQGKDDFFEFGGSRHFEIEAGHALSSAVH